MNTPVLNPQKSPSQSNTRTDEFLRTHHLFNANLASLYMSPTTYKFRFPKDRNFDHYAAYASKNLEQLSIWQNKRLRFFQFQVNLLKPTQHDLNTNSTDITTDRSVKKLHHRTYKVFLQQKHPQKIIFRKTTNSPLHSLIILSNI